MKVLKKNYGYNDKFFRAQNSKQVFMLGADKNNVAHGSLVSLKVISL